MDHTRQVARYEKTFLTCQGQEIPVCVSFRIMPGAAFDQSEVLLEGVVDLRNEKAKEETLTTLEAYWHAIFESCSEGLAVFDEDGHFLDVNPAWEKLMGYSKQEALNPSFSVEKILNAETIAKLRKAISQADQSMLKQTVHAKDGQASMEKLLARMESIYHQAQQTTKILSTIADIAFQTNILSLNASVEAARAASHGKSFAVIAAEIHTLANKVSAETQQIDDWLKSLVQETRLGKEAIADNTAKVKTIANGAKEVANRMNAISKATVKTDKSIHQIKATIADLDQGVQQSATMVEEVLTTANTLLNQTEEMSNAVGVFSTDTDTKPQSLISSSDSQATFAKPSNQSRFPARSKRLYPNQKKTRGRQSRQGVGRILDPFKGVLSD